MLQQTIAKHKDEFEALDIDKFLALVADERYELLLKRGVTAFESGESILLEAPFTRHIADTRKWEQTIAPFLARGITPTLCWINVSDITRGERLLARDSERDKEKVKDLANYLLQNPSTPPRVPHIEVNGESDFAKVVFDNF